MSSSWFDDFGDDPVTYWFVDYIEHLLTKINLYIHVCVCVCVCVHLFSPSELVFQILM